MTLNDAKRERVTAAEDAWRAARQAYWDEADKYVGKAVIGDTNAADVEPMTTESWRRLMQLRDAEHDALLAYKDALGLGS
jgi:hypothetical protein